MVPIIPVAMTKPTVSVGSPWTIGASSTAIGVVTDLMAIEATTTCDNAKSFARPAAAIRVESEPAAKPRRAGSAFSTNVRQFLWSGTASATVAGPRRNTITSLAGL
jgi:hypothetical protein